MVQRILVFSAPVKAVVVHDDVFWHQLLSVGISSNVLFGYFQVPLCWKHQRVTYAFVELAFLDASQDFLGLGKDGLVRVLDVAQDAVSVLHILHWIFQVLHKFEMRVCLHKRIHHHEIYRLRHLMLIRLPEQRVSGVEDVLEDVVDLAVVADLVVDDAGVVQDPLNVEAGTRKSHAFGVALQVVEFVHVQTVLLIGYYLEHPPSFRVVLFKISFD
mmetsp:Transcript_5438/g.4122  ORF Transcript_5438/g.4122 Transcript_5438/m.4122 type:complete len:215 (-) Transcript_5438:597-1241(-)